MNKKIISNNDTVRLRDRILLSPVTKYVVGSLIVGVILSTIVYLIMILVLNNIDDDWPASCDIKSSYQVDCLTGQKFDYDTCTTIGCCWSDKTKRCFHSLPSKHGYYQDNVDENNENIGNDVTLRPRREFSPMGKKNWPSLYCHTTTVDSDYVKINLRSKKIFNKLRNTNESNINNINSGLSVLINSPAFSITVLRQKLNSTNINLLTTSLGPLIATENYWEWTIYATNITLYGLESTYLNGITHLLYNNLQNNKYPIFFGITVEGEAFAWYISYSGPMEIKVLNNSNLIILKGMSLPDEITLNVFASSTPQQTIMRLVKSLENDGLIMKINTVPLSIIAGSFGLHICPEWNYIESSIVDSIKSIVEYTTREQVPWDSHCIHREFYPTLDTVLNKNKIKLLNESRKIIEEAGKQLVPHLTPMILADSKILVSKLENKSLVLKQLSSTYVGFYGETRVAYPDWSNNKIYNIFENYIINYINTFGISKLLIVRDAWPRDDTKNISFDISQFDYMPAKLQQLMTKWTIPVNLTSMTGILHYTTHNLYANSFYNFIQQSASPLASKEILFGNINNNSMDIVGWSILRATVDRAIGSCLVGQLPPIIYVCTTSANIIDELCTRWYGAAVVFPYIIVIPEYLPGGKWITTGTSRYANKLLKLRASLITYQRTVMEEYYNLGQPVLAPIYFYYSMDPLLNRINNVEQFFWGQSLLIGLVTSPNTRQLEMIIPGNLSWRHLEDGVEVLPTSSTGNISIVATEGEIIILVRPGHIVPIHENVFPTTAQTVESGINLIVNLACNEENLNCLAQGKIGYGSGLFLKIIVNETVVTLENLLNVKSHACVTSPIQSTLIKYLTILGDKLRWQVPLGIDLCINNNDVLKKII